MALKPAPSMAAEDIHLAIANVENAAGGFGITPQLAEELFGMGLDVLTTGMITLPESASEGERRD